MNDRSDDPALDSLLAGAAEEFDDAPAFTAAVMQRIREADATVALDAPAALVRLQREGVQRRRAARWRRRGIAVGSLLATGSWLALAGPASAMPHPLVLALAAAACAWALAAPALQES